VLCDHLAAGAVDPELHTCTAASQPASWTYHANPGSQVTMVCLAEANAVVQPSYGAVIEF